MQAESITMFSEKNIFLALFRIQIIITAMMGIDEYTLSKLAYCLRTVSPVGIVGGSIGVCATLISALHWELNLCNLVLGTAGLSVLLWFAGALLHWFSDRVTIPQRPFFGKKGKANKFSDCVHLHTRSLLHFSGIPVLSYNTNHYIGGQADGQDGRPNVMAQFLHRYFDDQSGDAYSFNESLFEKCYLHPETVIYDAGGEELKGPKPPFTRYTKGCKAKAGSFATLPKGGLMLLHLPTAEEGGTVSSGASMAVFLFNTWVGDNEKAPCTDTETMLLCLRNLWKVAQAHPECKREMYLPLLGTGSPQWKEGKYAAVWSIVSSYRQAYQGSTYRPGTSLHVCITPTEVRRLDVSIILNLMTYALRG